MAAKQGTLAQLSAKAEDTKRAVLQKAGASSWFHHLNTVCTIKSAPPRSPDVLALLATKSGWLYKRNEQHVWQARWCCVVPHTFLYYFDGGIMDAPAGGPPIKLAKNPASAQQQAWNAAVREGLGNRKPHEKRTHFPLFQGGGGGDTNNPPHNNNNQHTTTNDNNNYPDTTTADDPSNNNNSMKSGVAQPAGIIDLECYTNIHRSSTNPHVMELAGDDQVNPDLRSFYFCCDSSDDTTVDEWNTALLGHRHASLTDEVDAYKQVADGFAQQLQGLHSELDAATALRDTTEQELYRVRSAAEETRRAVYRVTEDCVERPLLTNTTNSNSTVVVTETVHERRTELRDNLETIRQQDMGVSATVQLMADYLVTSDTALASLEQKVQTMQSDVQKTGQLDQQELEELQEATHQAQLQHETEKQQLLQQIAVLQATHQTTVKELQDVQKDLSSTKMEVTMLMSQQRNKLATQQQHKKILKKEVVELRQKLEDAASENSSLKHENEKMKLQLEQERSKGNLLTRYVDKMESQVQVQQNMMEMMSQAGGSVYGGGMSVQQQPSSRSVASRTTDNDFTPNRRNRSSSSTAVEQQQQQHGDDDDAQEEQHRGVVVVDEDDDNDGCEAAFEDPQRLLLPARSSPPKQRRRWNNNSRSMVDHDMDNKSHMSELTEDRTQREFVAFQQQQQHQVGGHYPHSPSMMYNNHHQHHQQTDSGSRKQDLRYRKRAQEQQLSQQIYGPPTVIIGVKKTDTPEKRDSLEDEEEEEDDDGVVSSKDEFGRQTLDTIGRTAPSMSLPSGVAALGGPPSVRRTKHIPRSGSVSSSEQTLEAGKKLSVAQRARIEADRKTTPVRARIDDHQRSWFHGGQQQQQQGKPQQSTPEMNEEKKDSPSVASSRQSLWKRLVVLGSNGGGEDDDDEHSESTGSRSEPSDTEKKKDNQDESRLSLQQRSQLQREKQLRFLQNQGLVNDESDLPGGAGAETRSVTSSASSNALLQLGSPARNSVN